MNQSKKNIKEAADIGIYDIHTCFDSLWLKECINDLYESGFTNEKLMLIYMSNKNATIAIKTSSGTTRNINISEVVMQGTVWSGLICTNTMDKLCQEINKNYSLIYKYRGIVKVPPLEMIDDIINVYKCVEIYI